MINSCAVVCIDSSIGRNIRCPHYAATCETQQDSQRHPRMPAGRLRAAIHTGAALAVAFGDFTHRHVAVSHFAPDHFVNLIHGGFSFAVQ